MNEYYLKRCCSQELGSVERTGVPQRGRYLLTSMSEEILSFFPPLSKEQLNDSAILPVIPLYSGEKVYCNYVYHNDKYHGSTARLPRNEYRFYLNKSLEGDSLRFTTGDIVVFRKEEITEDDIKQTVYLMDLVHPGETEYYNRLNTIIDEYSLTAGGYGLYRGLIDIFENKVESVLENQPSVKIDDSVTTKIINTSANAIADLFNPSSFRDFVMLGYGNRCAITGTVIQCKSYSNLEAAHIWPKSHGGLLMPNNGIALCRDMHWAFDKGFFTLNDNLQIQVHPDVESDYLLSFNGKSIRKPDNSFFIPDPTNLNYHQNNVYGLFLTSGRL